PLNPDWVKALTWRPIGPATMGGRITALSVYEADPSTYWVATASGGLLKTTNNGTTWAPVFDHQATVSLGAVAVARSHPDTVWVGTGEANARNSVSWGDGVYKSTDGGKTWANMGLRDTRHVGRIVIHPRNPAVVYVAALGHVWGPNSERGVYKTTDGGATWQRVCSVSPDTGFIDLAMDPEDPETLYAAAYHVRRDAFAGGNPASQYSTEAGLFRTTDGGTTWQRLSRGLPDRPIGRCGLAVSQRTPGRLYAVVQTDRTLLKRESELGQAARTGGPAETGGVFRSDDRGATWVKVNDLCPRPFYFSQIRIDPNDDRRLYVLGVTLHISDDGGRTFRSGGAPGVHADHHALWIDPADSNHLVLGCDGGLYFSYDRGAAWEHLQNLPIAQFYGVAVDGRRPYHVYGGLQDNGTWGGPVATRSREGVTLADWTRVLAADGFECQVDPTDPDTVYAETQYGGLTRVNVHTGASRGITPKPAGEAPAYRFNWDSPVLLSPHNPRTLYYGGNHLLRSVDRGDTWQEVSPDLTRGQPGPSADYGHTLTAIAESPRRAGLLWTGSDDGRVCVSLNGGGKWLDVSQRLPGVPAERWVTRLECSHFAEGTAYLALDRHRQDDRAPYLFRTDDYGSTWRRLTDGLPAEGPVHVVREDPRVRNLLFVGTEFGLFVSLDAGASWRRLGAGLPTVAVYDLVIHPRDRELVIATHGRGLYVLDVAPLEEMAAGATDAEAYLFEVKPGVLFQYRGSHGLTGGREFTAPNPARGVVLWYYLKQRPPQGLRLTITDALGNTVAVLSAGDVPGLHRAVWDMQATLAFGPFSAGTPVPAGDYVARLTVGGTVLVRKVHVEAEE
ncbi:MAG TPA: hypothetical protein VJ739_11090, partial [Gemmataceae bacterium]|nr:hypothetical protein [Gemmataceae bacterium]